MNKYTCKNGHISYSAASLDKLLPRLRICEKCGGRLQQEDKRPGVGSFDVNQWMVRVSGLAIKAYKKGMNLCVY